MKTKFLALLFTASVLLSCQNKINSVSSTDNAHPSHTSTHPVDVPYTIAQRYFVKNTVKSIADTKIETAEKFEELFGMAPVMGQGGSPTEINFTTHYALAVMQPETESETTLKPVSLQKTNTNEITFKYKVKKGEKKTYTIVPVLILFVDKTSDGKVVVQEIK